METNFLVCGLLWSGSSAVTDLLSEYACNTVLPGEFDEFRRPGMIADHLENNLSESYPSKLEAFIQARRKRSYQSLYGTLKSPAHWSRLRFRLLELKRLSSLKRLKKNLNSSTQEDQLSLVQNWLDEYVSIYGKGAHKVFDQPIIFSKNRSIWPQVFYPFKMIVVYRDPMDQFAEIMRRGHWYRPHPDWPAMGEETDEKRQQAFELQVQGHKTLLTHVKSVFDEQGSDRMLFVKFEDLVKNYALNKQAIEAFLGLSSDTHHKPKSRFDPAQSKANIGIAQDYLRQDEIEELKKLKTWINNLGLYRV